ncbi:MULTISPECIES: pilus assembly protein [unclassified Sinorhizobium]|uniref:pilus assembly protein n=1 Tax=unclassified Sinorhizobium TaxID=2613772 RepID=UPI0024C2D7A6|nr:MULTISPECIES: pilus assembly protein [unclassified Sinorhizobium]MDK1375447.1 pilus assembly protein [Sinorhizobium sp. 6-70]MDK1481841.1 pilus assembly protein [Sinorhizobium sp. 6-117]
MWEANLPLRKDKSALLVMAAASLLSGCADYLNHRDSITFGLGNAVEANKGIHTQDPFPRVAYNTRIPSDGKVINRVIRNYQGAGQNGAAPTPTAVILPGATMPPGAGGGNNGGNGGGY